MIKIVCNAELIAEHKDIKTAQENMQEIKNWLLGGKHRFCCVMESVKQGNLMRLTAYDGLEEKDLIYELII